MNETELQRLLVRLVGDNADFKRMIEDAVRQVDSANREIQRAGGVMEKSVSANLTIVSQGIATLGEKITGVGRTITGFFSDLARQAVEAAGRFEQTTISFTTMLGSAEEANNLLGKLTEFAATTPFEQEDVEEGAIALKAMGASAKDILPELKALGDVSAGLSVPMGRLILNFGQVRNTGKLMGRELRDFSIAGVPLIAELSKNLGVSENAIAGMVSKGRISFEETKKAFMTMTSEGGAFANLMEEQSKSMQGQISNLKDVITILSREIGQTLLPVVKAIVGWLASAVQILRDLSPGVKQVIGVVLAIGTALGGLLMIVGPIVAALGSLGLAISGLTALGGVISTVVAAIAPVLPAIIALGVVLASVAAGFVAVGVAAYNLIGKQRLAEWWGAAKDAASDFFTKVKGFFAHFGENVHTLIEWFKKNWKNLFKDLVSWSVEFAIALPHNLYVAVETIERMLTVFGGWLGVKMHEWWATAVVKVVPIIVDLALFLHDQFDRVMAQIAMMLVARFNAVQKFLKAAADLNQYEMGVAVKELVFGTDNAAIKKETGRLAAQFSKDITAGITTSDPVGEMVKVWNEQKKKFEIPEFKSTTDPLKLNLDLTEKITDTSEKTAEAVKETKKQMQELSALYNDLVRGGTKEFVELQQRGLEFLQKNKGALGRGPVTNAINRGTGLVGSIGTSIASVTSQAALVPGQQVNRINQSIFERIAVGVESLVEQNSDNKPLTVKNADLASLGAS